jgi:hypothetical protein
MLIGKIVSSSSHVDYVCQVYGPGEAEQVPAPGDYGFGTFVGIEHPDGGYLVGVIHNTTLMNPEFGNLGPRLSPREDLAIFSPDYLAEKVTLVAVAVLGAVEHGHPAQQGVPLVAPSLDARVRTLSQDEIVAFHDVGGGVKLAYLPMLTAMKDPLAPHLMLHIVAALSALFPVEAQRLAILGGNLAWKARVQPVG